MTKLPETKKGECDTCGQWKRADENGVLYPHYEKGSTTEVCMGRSIRKPRPDEYPVGYDSDPWVWSGGSWESKR
jgi:hypothetical protein